MSVVLHRVLWAAALILLAGALAYFNLPVSDRAAAAPRTAEAAQEASAEAPSEASAERFVSSASYGFEVGEQLPDFTLTRTDGSVFTLSEYRGRVVILNLWATWCAPCVKELPYFDRLLREHPGEVEILAIHSDMISDDVAAFLADFDYRIGFVVDESGSVIASVNGSTMLPQTVVLNAYGEVTYNRVASVTYEMLEELLAAAAP